MKYENVKINMKKKFGLEYYNRLCVTLLEAYFVFSLGRAIRQSGLRNVHARALHEIIFLGSHQHVPR